MAADERRGLLEAAGFRIPPEWGVVSVGELLASDRGISVGVMYPGDHDSLGVPLIRVGDLVGDRVNLNPEFRISVTTHRKYRRTELEGGELLMTLVGDIGRCAVVPAALRGWNAARAVAVMRFNDPRHAPYVRACFLSRHLRHLLDAWSNTTVQQTINLKEVRQLPLPWPPQDVRDQIATVLGALDEKIELNRGMNESLEAMARAVFKSWFIDFDPVRAKMAGRAPVGMDAATADIFPTTLDNGCPSGWTVKPYGAGVTVTKGKSYKSGDLRESTTALVTLKSFLRGGGYRDDGLKAYAGEFKSEQVVAPGSLVVAFTDVTQAAEVIGKPALVRSTSQFTTLVASLDVGIVRSCAPELPIEYLYYRFLDSEFQEHAYAHSNGSTVLHLESDAIERFEGIWPSHACAEAFQARVGPLLDLQNANWAQISTLAALRDLLLPKLLSGELRVRDAEREVEKVA